LAKVIQCATNAPNFQQEFDSAAAAYEEGFRTASDAVAALQQAGFE
jgi:hypothetical protein